MILGDLFLSVKVLAVSLVAINSYDVCAFVVVVNAHIHR